MSANLVNAILCEWEFPLRVRRANWDRSASAKQLLSVFALFLGLWLPAPRSTAAADAAAPVDIDQVVWGYDGRIVRNQFNLVSLLINNPTPNTFDGTLLLRRRAGAKRTIGATIAHPVFLSPYTSKWVQFKPYVTDDRDEWLLSAEGNSEWTNTLPQPRFGPPARVVLADATDEASPRAKLGRFSELLFPTSVTATDGLGGVLLDHVPRWEPARRTAFLDWIYRGGIVHLFRDERKEFPNFPPSLSELNSTDEVQHVGRGVIYRHPKTLNEIDDRFLTTLEGFGKSATGSDDRRSLTFALDTGSSSALELFAADDFRMFAALRSLSRNNRSWVIIYALSAVYLLLLFPGCYLIGRSRADYRVSYLALFVSSSVFSTAFFLMGRAGADATSTVHSVAIARPLQDRDWDVWQWSDAFAGDGGWYELEHGGSGRIYSTCESFQPVNGTIGAGPDSRMNVDIPPNSSRSFAHRAKIEKSGFQLNLVNLIAVGSQLQEIALSAEGRLPTHVDQVLALYHGRFYRLAVHEGGTIRMDSAASAMGPLLQLNRFDPFEPDDQARLDRERTAEREFRSLLYPLILRSLALTQAAGRDTVAIPIDRVFILMYAPMPPDFFIRSDRFGKQSGTVLYVFSYPVSGGI